MTLLFPNQNCLVMARYAFPIFLLMCIMKVSGAKDDTDEESSCNRTILKPSMVTIPLLEPHLVGSPLLCSIKIKMPPHLQSSSVIKIEFYRLKVGEMNEEGVCGETHMIIRDGGGGNGSSQQDYGRFCGESEQIYSYIAEFPDTDIVIATDHLDDDLDYDFQVSFVEKAELPLRFGPRPDLYPHIRGNLVANTFCERVFQDCNRLQTCYVQSPGYPGIYPRNLKCRYYLSSKQPHIKLYVDRLQPQQFNVAGQDCDSIVSCPSYAIGERPCEKDFVKIYDGVDEFSALIGTFCGVGGNFPSSIVGTGKELFLEFQTARESAFPGGTGFDLRVSHLPGNIQSYDGDGRCHWIFGSEQLEGSKTEGLFLSLEHWYPPETNCTYHVRGRPGEIARLYFPSFKIGRIENPLRPEAEGDCRESLTVYDDSWPNGERIIKTFCDGFSRPLEKFDFVSSSGSSLFVAFYSTTGSYSGSALQFWAQYDFFDGRKDGISKEGTLCDETFSSEMSFRSPRNTLVFKDAQSPIRCNYDIHANRREYGRVELTLDSLRLKQQCSDSCWQDNDVDHIEVVDDGSRLPHGCLTNCSAAAVAAFPKKFVSRGSHIRLTLMLNHKTAMLNYFKTAAPLFTASIKFVHPKQCGPFLVPSEGGGGVISFPATMPADKQDVVCVWDVRMERRELKFSFANFTFQSDDCDSVSLDIGLAGNKEPFHRQCKSVVAGGGNQPKIPIIKQGMMEQQQFIQIVFRMSGRTSGKFQLKFTNK